MSKLSTHNSFNLRVCSVSVFCICWFCPFFKAACAFVKAVWWALAVAVLLAARSLAATACAYFAVANTAAAELAAAVKLTGAAELTGAGVIGVVACAALI